jgi:hypothetical protein
MNLSEGIHDAKQREKSRHRRTRSMLLSLLIAILCATGGEAQVQAPVQYQETKPEGVVRRPEGPVRGSVVQISNDRIIIETPESGEVKLPVGAGTLYAKERRIIKSELAVGDSVLVMTDRQRGLPSLVKVLLPDRQRKGSPHPFRMGGNKGGGSEAGPMQGSLAAGPMQDGPAGGPMRGLITQVDPLTIELASGGTTVVNTTERTQFLRETAIEPGSIAPGSTVMVVFQFRPGSDRNEAFKVIVLAAGPSPVRPEPDFMAEQVPSRPGKAIQYIDSPFGFLMAPPQPAYLFDLGVHWMVTGTRLASWEDIETQKGMYDFSRVDKNLTYLYENGVNTILELRAINPLYGTSSGKRVIRGVSFPEEHLEEWSRFVEKFVERYDGDGIDDAPGSPIVRNYQLVHELLWPGNARKDFFRQHPDKYAKFFKVTYDAMKKSCNDCSLYFIGGFEDDFLFRGDKTMNGKVAENDGFFINLLREFQKEKFTIQNIGFDYHYWSFWHVRPEAGPESYKGHQRFIDHIKHLYRSFGYSDDEASIISMESGVNGYLDSERDQADYVVKIYASSLAAGQKYLFWTSVVEYSQEAGLYLGMGLVHNPLHHGYSHKKLAYYTYKLMTEKLRDTDWKRVGTVINGAKNVYCYRFPRKKEGRPVYVVWMDGSEGSDTARKAVDLHLGLQSQQATVTVSVPDAKNGLEVKNAAHFAVERIPVRNGVVTLPLGTDPVYIEEGAVPQPFYPVQRTDQVILDRLFH